MFELFIEVYVRVVESFGVVFGLVGQLFKYRPWMLPLIPITALVIYFGSKVGSQGEQRPQGAPRRPEQYRRGSR